MFPPRYKTATTRASDAWKATPSPGFLRTLGFCAALFAWSSFGSLVRAQIVDPAFTPNFNDDVHVIAAYPGGRTLVGGDFSAFLCFPFPCVAGEGGSKTRKGASS